MRSEVKPEPVPPPNEWKIRKPWSPGTLISQLPDPVQNEVDDLFTDGVMASRIVIGGVFLSCDELLRVEQLAIDAGADLICFEGQKHAKR